MQRLAKLRLRFSVRVCATSSLVILYRLDKERENTAALQVLPDLLKELDGMAPRERLLALVQGVLAANIFDWGARACVQLYHAGTILGIYREAREKLSQRPWRVDQFDALRECIIPPWAEGQRVAEGGWGPRLF